MQDRDTLPPKDCSNVREPDRDGTDSPYRSHRSLEFRMSDEYALDVWGDEGAIPQNRNEEKL